MCGAVEKSRRLISRQIVADESILVSSLVLLEAEWALHSRDELPKPEILRAFSALLQASERSFFQLSFKAIDAHKACEAAASTQG